MHFVFQIKSGMCSQQSRGSGDATARALPLFRGQLERTADVQLSPADPPHWRRVLGKTVPDAAKGPGWVGIALSKGDWHLPRSVFSASDKMFRPET